jgi:elongation factor P
MPNVATDIRKGSVLILDGDLFVCTEFQHKTPGNLRGNVQTKLKGLRDGRTIQRKFASTERVEFAFLDKRLCEYLYKDNTAYVFMDAETFEQFHLDAELVQEQMRFIIENAQAAVTFHDGNPVSIELPSSVELKVTHTEPGVKGDTVSNVFKPATLETGLEIKVPNHISIGDVVKVSTETTDFLGRSQA